MSKEEKKYSVDDILDEYNISEGKSAFDAFYKGNGADEASAEAADVTCGDTEAEEISEADGVDADVTVVTDELEADPTEAVTADISLAGESEWESPDLSEITDNTAFDDKTEDSEDDENAEDTEAASDTSLTGGSAEVGEAEEKEDVNQKFVTKALKAILPWKGDGVGEIIRKIIFLAAVIVFIGAGIMLASTLIQSRRAVRDNEDVESVFESIMNGGGETTVVTTIDEQGSVITITQSKPDANVEFNLAEHYKSIAPDYVGFLELDGCNIKQPVVQAEDNDYYLTHTYYGGTNKAGALFMDYRCTFTEEYDSPNIVIYGHNQEDGTMFGNLKEYKQNVKFYAENPVVKLISEKETSEYLIYGFFVTNALARQDSNGIVFHYQDYIETLNDENTFNWYMEMIRERNQIVSPVDVKYGDKLLCLSTCSNEFSNSRFVVFARKLRDGESAEDFDFSKAYLNPYAKGVDWDAIMSGETTASSETTTMSETTSDFEIQVFVEEFTADTQPPEETAKKKKKKKTTPAETEESTKRTIKKRPVTDPKTETTTEGTASDITESGETASGETVSCETVSGETVPESGALDTGTDVSDTGGGSPAETAPPADTENPEGETATAS